MSASGKIWVNLKHGKVSHVLIRSSASTPFNGTETVVSVQDITDPLNPQDFDFVVNPIFHAAHPRLLIIKLKGLHAVTLHSKIKVTSGTVGDTGKISITLSSGTTPIDVPVVFVDDLTSSP